jgi:hypothetical protein
VVLSSARIPSQQTIPVSNVMAIATDNWVEGGRMMFAPEDKTVTAIQ